MGADFYDNDDEENDRFDDVDDAQQFPPLQMGQDDPEEEDDDEEDNASVIPDAKVSNEHELPPTALCSVLNTVVDYCMMAPTATFEPEECQQHQQNPPQLLPSVPPPPRNDVPVLRFFGPILRRAGPSSSAMIDDLSSPSSSSSATSSFPNTPVQSACLYVHGAFPYLLARPVAAGPDGSSGGSGNGSNIGCPWDSVTAVQRMIPVLTEALEGKLHETNTSFAKSSSNTTSTGGRNTAKPQHQQRLLRRITVVTGRGFYTYCPGPAAPFLRVEYYNPSDRWKVKRCLEQGLVDLMPLELFHPQPRFGSSDTEAEDVDEDAPLRFNCYEAHIPYTMQVFKDLNLAGLSYIHVAEAAATSTATSTATTCNTSNTFPSKFRHPLPSSIRPTVLKSRNNEASSSLAFLASNTPLQFQWIDNGNGHGTAVSALNKLTSCDVELDIHVSSILNVLDVMTELPDEWEERQQIHWRAVPSLREIWSQERRRMAKLLQPKDDFLSDRSDEEAAAAPPPFTLNVKKDAPLSGARLAVEGMQRLLHVTAGLEDNFRRVMKDIVERHSNAFSQADAVLRQARLRRSSAPTTRFGTIASSQQTPPSVDESERDEDGDNLTPSHDEAMEALGALQDLFESPSSSPLNPDVPSSNVEPPLSSSSQCTPSSSQKLIMTLSQACASSVEETPGSVQAEFRLSQCVERGDGIVDSHFHCMDDVIDPETLAPYETFDDEDDDDNGSNGSEDGAADDTLDERKVEQMLSTLATQDYMSSGKAIRATGDDNSEDDSSVESRSLLSDKNKKARAIDLICKSDEESSADVNSTDGTLSAKSDKDAASDKLSPKDPQFAAWHHAPNVRIEYRGLPPSRRDVSEQDNGVTLLPKPTRGATPQWTGFMAEYAKTRSPSPKESWFPAVGEHGVSVRPVKAAPTRKAVSMWTEKQSKRKQSLDAELVEAKRLKLKTGNGTMSTTSSARLSTAASAKTNEVEVAVWQLSQESTQSLSQDDKNLEMEIEARAKGPDVASSTPSLSAQHHNSFPSSSEGTCHTPFEAPTQQQSPMGIGNQGGRMLVEGGGDLKARTKQTQTNGIGPVSDSVESYPLPVSIMAIEVYVHCRMGRAGVNDSRTIALTPVSDRDKICSVAFVLCRDPGGGEPLEFLEFGCIFVPIAREMDNAGSDTPTLLRRLASDVRKSLPPFTLGVSAPMAVECVADERQLLLRVASIVRYRDPDMLLSWDTQGAGLGYLIERGLALGKETSDGGSPSKELDMARLLGRTPTVSSAPDSSHGGPQLESEDAGSVALAEMSRSTAGVSKVSTTPNHQWKGSGLGADWDERVGAGAAASSISGRLVFAAWKIVAEEVKHPNYSYLPAIVSLVLNKRIPFHDNLKLGQWYGHERGRERWRVLHYKLAHAVASLQLFDALDIVGRAGEAARLSGVEFSQSFPGIRGSQYKVEGVLLRALKSLNSEERGSKKGRRRPRSTAIEQESLSAESASQTQSPWKARRGGAGTSQVDGSDSQSIHNLSDRCYYFFSPSLQDTTRQEALETQALTLEPQSGHYIDPVVVCDFTALYPSLMIAYNLCFSTCAGKLQYHATRAEMRLQGKTTGQVGPMQYAESKTAGVLKYHVKSLYNEAQTSRDRAYVAPTGAVYVSETVVKGVLPQVLDEMLSTRAMLKKAAKQYKKCVPNLSKSILRQLEARQLALKYVANVTYGYTSATFSGRCAMPLLADTIVECGRRTLSNAIKLAGQWGKEPTGRWKGIEVLYGDTDSIFIKMPGRSVEEAFQFGEEFCKAVTDNNPPPVQLKLEKVYYGSMMQTKKKYCGMKFESKDQKRPTFEAKGIETIRRDQCALTQKILENSLVMLYRNGIDAVKSYLFRQWSLILSGRLPVSDFILTGRVRSRYRGGRVGPVQAVLSRRLAEADPARVVRHKERQAYVIVATPGIAFKLRDCVLTPMELLEQWDAYSIHFAYYITKHVNAALQRCLGLAPYFVNISAWFDASPKPRRRIHFWPSTRSRQSTMMISSFFGSDKCSLCGRKCLAKSRSRASVCSRCRNDPVQATMLAMHRLRLTQEKAHASAAKCSQCNLCLEDSHTFATVRSSTTATSTSAHSHNILVTPLANCTCIDCPVTFERHQQREDELEALAVCEALELI